jgi:hypothetical protein
MIDAERKPWQALYRAALLELDRSKLPSALRAAEQAIQERLASLSQSSNQRAERQAMADALQNLRVLRQTEFPDEPS